MSLNDEPTAIADQRYDLVANNWWRDGCPICGADGCALPQPHLDDERLNAYLKALNTSASVIWYENCLEEIAAIVIRTLDRVKVLSNAYLKYRFGFTDEETCSLIYHLLDMRAIKLRSIALNQWGITLSEDGKGLFDPVPSTIGSQGYLAVAGSLSDAGQVPYWTRWYPHIHDVAEDIFKKKLIMQYLVRMLAQKRNEK